jgi:hypothetical protein
MMKLTKGKGVLGLNLDKKNWIYSDDTVMHIATAKALIAVHSNDGIE